MTYTHVFQINPSDTLETAADAFMVAGDGSVAVLPASSKDPVVLEVFAGEVYNIAIRQVLETDTTVDTVFGLA